MPVELLGKSAEELREFAASLGERPFRGAQLYHAIYAERRFEFSAMTNLPAALRERLARRIAHHAAAYHAPVSFRGRIDTVSVLDRRRG